MWLMVSKAAEISRLMSATREPSSMWVRMSLTTRTIAVSVECMERYADCNGLKLGDDIMCSFNFIMASRYSNFDMLDKFMIGR
jgi:hypothetical protein